MLNKTTVSTGAKISATLVRDLKNKTMWEIKKNNYVFKIHIYIIGTRITRCISQGDFLGIIHWILPIIKKIAKKYDQGFNNMLCI